MHTFNEAPCYDMSVLCTFTLSQELVHKLGSQCIRYWNMDTNAIWAARCTSMHASILVLTIGMLKIKLWLRKKDFIWSSLTKCIWDQSVIFVGFNKKKLLSEVTFIPILYFGGSRVHAQLAYTWLNLVTGTYQYLSVYKTYFIRYLIKLYLRLTIWYQVYTAQH